MRRPEEVLLPPDDGAGVFDEAVWEARLAAAPPVDAPLSESPFDELVVPDAGPGFGECATSGWLAWHRHTTTPHDHRPEPPAAARPTTGRNEPVDPAAEHDDPDLDPPPF